MIVQHEDLRFVEDLENSACKFTETNFDVQMENRTDFLQFITLESHNAIIARG